MDEAGVIASLEKFGRLTEVREVRTFVGYRNDKLGYGRKIIVEVMDAGPGKPLRYRAKAYDEEGRVATGNPGNSLDETLPFLYWNNLESDYVEPSHWVPVLRSCSVCGEDASSLQPLDEHSDERVYFCGRHARQP
jgi:hypothetical protein